MLTSMLRPGSSKYLASLSRINFPTCNCSSKKSPPRTNLQLHSKKGHIETIIFTTAIASGTYIFQGILLSSYYSKAYIYEENKHKIIY